MQKVQLSEMSFFTSKRDFEFHNPKVLEKRVDACARHVFHLGCPSEGDAGDETDDAPWGTVN